MVSAWLPPFAIVNVFSGDVMPTGSPMKSSDIGVSENTGDVDCPISGTWNDTRFGSSVVSVTVAFDAATCVGLNAICTGVDDIGATVNGAARLAVNSVLSGP